MFLKLLKHDLISLKNSFLILFIITICVGLIAPFLVFSMYKFSISTNEDIGLGLILIFGIYALILVYIMIASVLFIVNAVRFFRNSFFSSQGYLTLTLPISTTKNVISKLLSIVIWAIGFFLVAYVSFFVSMAILNILLIQDSGSDVSIWQSIEDVFKTIFNNTSSFENMSVKEVFTTILAVFLMIDTPILTLVLMLFVITLGNIKPFKKHAVLSSILFAILIYFTVSIGSTNLATYISDDLIRSIVILLLEIALVILGTFGIVKLIDHKVEIS